MSAINETFISDWKKTAFSLYLKVYAPSLRPMPHENAKANQVNYDVLTSFCVFKTLLSNFNSDYGPGGGCCMKAVNLYGEANNRLKYMEHVFKTNMDYLSKAMPLLSIILTCDFINGEEGFLGIGDMVRENRDN